MARVTDGHRATRDSRARAPHAGVDVDTAAVLLVDANPDRIGIYVCNTSISEDVYLGLGDTAAAGEGIHLPPRAGMYLDTYDGAITGVATASARVTWAEV